MQKTKGMGTVASILVIILLFVVAGGIYLATRNQASAPTENSNEAMEGEDSMTQGKNLESAMDDESVMGDGAIMDENTVKEFNVVGTNFQFSLSEIKVKEGDIVKINFSNGGGFHDFVVDEFSARTRALSDGENQTIEFVASKKGTFEFYCSVGNHRAMGMIGNLIVE